MTGETGIAMRMAAGPALAALAMAAAQAAAQEAAPPQAQAAFYSGGWTDIAVDKQIIIERLASRALVAVTCEGIVNDTASPRFLMVTDQGEYRWPINESGSVFLELEQLAIRRAGNGPVVFCEWRALDRAETEKRTLHSDVRPGDAVLLAGFAGPREFSVTFQNRAGCAPLAAHLVVDGVAVATADGVEQPLTPDATFLGMGQNVEAKITGLCPPDALPVLEVSIAGPAP